MESFNGKRRNEWLHRERFLSLAEARHVVDEWRLDSRHHRPHSGIHGETPAAFAAATLAGASPLPAAQPANQQAILS